MQKGVIVAPKACPPQCNDCSNHCYKKLVPVLTVEQALEKWFDSLKEKRLSTEKIPLSLALGRVLDESVYAKVNVPVTNCATHDGIAIDFECCEAKFNAQNYILQPDEFFHCPMGTAIPAQFDSIVHAEQCKLNNDGTATLFELPVHYQSVKVKGTYIRKGEKLAGKNEILSPSHLALMQYTGHTTVSVKAKPKLAIIPVGEELVLPGENPAPGQYIDCNSIYISSIAEQHGGEAMIFPILPDEAETIANTLRKVLKNYDIVIVIGGVGKGELNYKDHSLRAVRAVGEVVCHGIRLDPGGKNMLLAQAEGKPILGIPGPPHAAITMTEYFVPAILEWFTGCCVYQRPVVDVELEQDFPSRGGNQNIWEARLHLHDDGEGFSARLVSNLGETVENFITATAAVSVTGDLSKYKKGKHIKARLLHYKKTVL